MKKFTDEYYHIQYQEQEMYGAFSKNAFTLKYIHTYFKDNPTHKNRKIIQFFLHHKKNNSI